MLMKYLNRLVCTLVIFCFILSHVAIPVLAEPLPDSELQALTSWPNWVSDACSIDTSASKGTFSGPVYIMGDSITDIAKKTYEAKFKDYSPSVDGLVSRHIVANNPNPGGLRKVEQDSSKIKAAKTIVIALGTNDEDNSKESIKKNVEQVTEAIKKTNSSAPIYWVNVADSNKSDGVMRSVNKAISDGLGANGSIIDWFNKAKTSPNYKSFEEGVHPQKQSDIDLLVNLVFDSVTNKSNTNNYKKATNGVKFSAGMAIDNDGIGPGRGDKYHQNGTSYANGKLNADETNYIALASTWASNKGLKLGDVALVKYKDKTAYAVYGDNWQAVDQVHGEGSVALAKALGINPSGISGGVTSGVEYTVFPGSNKQLKGSVDQSKIDEIGKALAGEDATATSTDGCQCGANDGGETAAASGKIPSDVLAAINKLKPDYIAAANKTKVPWQALAAIHYREAGNSPSKDLQAGNPIGGGGSQFASYPHGAPKSIEQSAEYAAEELISKASGGVVKKPVNVPSPEADAMKDALFGYNGRANVYAAQAASLGFSADKQPYEGSPYVMNSYDDKHKNMKMITRDFGGLDGTDTRLGAFTLYALLGGGTGGGGADCGSSAGENGWDLTGAHKMTFFDQCDGPWQNHPYGKGKSSVCEGGCGISSLAMVVSTLKGKKTDPTTLADRYGDQYHHNGTDWSLWPVAAKDYDLQYSDLGTDLNKASEVIKAGGLVIGSFGAGKFTSQGHFMVIRALDGKGGFYLADPNNKGNKSMGRGDTNNTAYSADTLRKEGALMHLWGFKK